MDEKTETRRDLSDVADGSARSINGGFQGGGDTADGAEWVQRFERMAFCGMEAMNAHFALQPRKCGAAVSQNTQMRGPAEVTSWKKKGSNVSSPVRITLSTSLCRSVSLSLSKSLFLSTRSP